MAHVSWKSHRNGVQNSKAHLRRAVDIETILRAPIIAEPLGVFDCCGVSDGAACAIVTTPEIARSLGKRELVEKCPRHSVIVMLAGVDEDGAEIVAAAHFGEQRRHLHEVGARAYDV